MRKLYMVEWNDDDLNKGWQDGEAGLNNLMHSIAHVTPELCKFVEDWTLDDGLRLLAEEAGSTMEEGVKELECILSTMRLEVLQSRIDATEEQPTLRYTKKPITIEAFQFTKERRTDNSDWPEWMHHAWNLERGTANSIFPTAQDTGDGTISIATLEGIMEVSWDDWVIRGVVGELYPCKPEVFAMSYDPVT
jgi:hypothetical protein